MGRGYTLNSITEHFTSFFASFILNRSFFSFDYNPPQCSDGNLKLNGITSQIKENIIDEAKLRDLLRNYKTENVSEDEAISKLRDLPYEDLDFAKVDHHRSLRKGFPEVIFGQSKTPDQITSISESLLRQSDRLLVTRASSEAFQTLKNSIPDAIYNDLAKTITVDRRDSEVRKPSSGVLVVCAGTADLPVALEAVTTAEMMDCVVERAFDIGVAGLHRLFDQLPALLEARVIIAVAGMEGALPSVIGGLVQVPVIAVPTSVGYGASFEGLAALLAMLNSCATGIGVVNIDNGFGAGYLASLIVHLPGLTGNP